MQQHPRLVTARLFSPLKPRKGHDYWHIFYSDAIPLVHHGQNSLICKPHHCMLIKHCFQTRTEGFTHRPEAQASDYSCLTWLLGAPEHWLAAAFPSVSCSVPCHLINKTFNDFRYETQLSFAVTLAQRLRLLCSVCWTNKQSIKQ